MDKPVLVQQFGDVANDQDGRGEEFGFYDNGVWQNILDIQFTPNAGPSNAEGLKDAEAFALYFRDNKVDVVLWTLWMEAPHIARLKSMCPGIKVIALTDHPLNVDLAMSPMPRSASYIHKIEGADAILTLTPRETGFYGGLHENVHYVNLPFPHKSYERWRVPQDHLPISPLCDREELTVGIAVGGPGHAWFDRNYLTTALAFKQFQRYMATVGRKVKGVWLSWSYGDQHPHQKAVHEFAQGVEGTAIQYRSDMQTYLKTLQGCDLVMSNITRDTPGRLVAECAWAGVPLVGSDSLSLQYECYPGITVDSFDIKNTVGFAIEVSKWGRGDKDECISTAREAMLKWNYTASRERFREVMRSIGYPDGEWATLGQEGA